MFKLELLLLPLLLLLFSFVFGTGFALYAEDAEVLAEEFVATILLLLLLLLLLFEELEGLFELEEEASSESAS